MEEATVTRTPQNRRLAGVAVIAFSSMAWWPAFTLGAWGTIFFEQLLTLWAAATAALVLIMLLGDVRHRFGWRSLALAIPTFWVLVALELEPGSSDELAWVGTLVTLAGAPIMMVVLIRFASPDLIEDTEPRDRIAVVSAVALVVVCAYLMGTAQEYMFTCGDFTISGNSQPPDCTPGDPSLVLQKR